MFGKDWTEESAEKAGKSKGEFCVLKEKSPR
jgi:hypothetical protein